MIAARRRQNVAIDAFGLLSEPKQKIRCILCLDTRRAQGFALLGRHGMGERLLAIDHETIGTVQNLGALEGGFPGPGRKGGLGRINGGNRIVPCPVGNVSERFPSGGIEHRKTSVMLG